MRNASIISSSLASFQQAGSAVYLLVLPISGVMPWNTALRGAVSSLNWSNTAPTDVPARFALSLTEVPSWHDLSVCLIAKFYGYKTAIETAKVFLISGHSEGQSPYSVMTRPMESNDGPISDCQLLIADNHATSKPVEKMLQRPGLNQRTSSRRFRAATGFSSIEYVQALRVEETEQMLEMDDHTGGDIGTAVGYDDPASLRRFSNRGRACLLPLTGRSFRGFHSWRKPTVLLRNRQRGSRRELAFCQRS